MLINTPCGKLDAPDCFADKYKGKTDTELLEILLNQNTTDSRFIDPVLVQILIDRGVITGYETFKQIKKRVKTQNARVGAGK